MRQQLTVFTASQVTNLQSTSVQLNLRSGDVVPNGGRLWIHGVHWFYAPGTTQFTPGTSLIGAGYGSFAPSNNPVIEQVQLAGLITQTTEQVAKARDISCNVPNGATQNSVYAFATGSGGLGAGNGQLAAMLTYDITPT